MDVETVDWSGASTTSIAPNNSFDTTFTTSSLYVSQYTPVKGILSFIITGYNGAGSQKTVYLPIFVEFGKKSFGSYTFSSESKCDIQVEFSHITAKHDGTMGDDATQWNYYIKVINTGTSNLFYKYSGNSNIADGTAITVYAPLTST